MKNFIWNLVKKHFKKELSEYVISLKKTHIYEYEQEKENNKLKINYPINQKVILRSNEPNDLIIGEVVDYNLHENSNQIFLVIKDIKTNEILYPFDKEPPYWTEEREKALNKLSWDEQWNVLTKYYSITKESKEIKESDEYLTRTNQFKK